MSLIEKTKNKIEEIFLKYRFNDVRNPSDEGLVISYFMMSKKFLSSSGVLQKESAEFSLVCLHLQGQAVELAIKGYILSCKVEPKTIHDLVALTSKAESLGLQLKQMEASSIVLLNHYFYQDLTTKTKFKTRYPTKLQETTGGPIPDQTVTFGLYDSILEQAKKQCELLRLVM